MIVEAKQQEKIKLRGIVRQVYKAAGKAINYYSMIEDKDRVLVGVSGGKDSLGLLKILVTRKAYLPIDFKVTACFVDVGFNDTDRSILEDYFKKENVPYVIKELRLKKEDINCFWCSWNKRKILFTTARELNCNKVALAHHLDDIVETILMNIFFHGQISSMKPRVDFFGGEISLIRPLAYLEKYQIESFCRKLGFPDTKHSSCPYSKDSKRQLIKKKISELKKDFPHVKTNIFRSLQRRNIREEYLP
ncbi:MAG: tRNA 2-thiocytidine(32) synthetase TtcA [Candidatus Omnitrophica bacterium]|nr:tRNA 2-thiocytidine(32) synthetase TtcA [Candidatus Omnitrophota bacterium]